MSQSSRQTPTWRQYSLAFREEAKRCQRAREATTNQLAYAKRLFTRGLPIIYDQEHLARLVGVDLSYLLGCSNEPKGFYRHFVIAKRNGKPREIAAPLPTLMSVQRWLLDNILVRCEPTPYAKAYVPRTSIRENARFHLRQETVVLTDIRDFFHSIIGPRVYRLFREMGYTKAVSALCAGLVTLEGRVPQGAPTSPAVSNLICRRIDARLAGFCIRRGWRYTRYADDIAISGNVNPGIVVRVVQNVIRDDGFRLKPEKTRVLHSHQCQLVTGVVVNSHQQAARATRRKLRQTAHYIRRFGISDHMQRCGISKTNYRAHLAGLAHHVLFLNPKDKDALALLQLLNDSPASGES